MERAVCVIARYITRDRKTIVLRGIDPLARYQIPPRPEEARSPLVKTDERGVAKEAGATLQN